MQNLDLTVYRNYIYKTRKQKGDYLAEKRAGMKGRSKIQYLQI